jgi:UDP-N-acetylglucosamine 4,6-dehydratase
MLNGKSILVTGGTGSFGKRFIRTVLARFQPRRLIVYSRDELKQYEMSKTFPEDVYPCMRYFLGDVRDFDRLLRALKGVDYVVHAAALKHVPAAEYNPFEFVKTNILGSQNLIEACIERDVRKVIALSTDKACNPVNLYGATKLAADKLFVAGNSYSGGEDTRFAIVRYGNVLGSRGSVVPLFLRLKETGTLPITDERMTRFWLTLDQAVDLVLTAFEKARGGEIFVPRIPSMRVVDVAKAVAPDCKLNVVGIRPGEKLHEGMISEDDAPHTYAHDGYYLIQPALHAWRQDPAQTPDGVKVPAGFSYTSDTNPEWLSPENLLATLADYRLVGTEMVRQDELTEAGETL